MAHKDIGKLVDDLDRLLKRVEDKTIAEMVKALEQAYTALEQRLTKLYPQYLDNKDTFPQVRARLLMDEVRLLLDLIKPRQTAYYTSRLESMISQSQGMGLKFAQSATLAIAPTTALATGLAVNIEAVRFASENAFDRLKLHSDSFKNKAVTIVSFNLAIGTGVRKVAAQLRAELGVVKSRAEAIARTETIAALAQSSEYFYRENDIEYVQLFATADDRTCRFCRASNMHVYKIGDVTVPKHVRCRCYLAPVKGVWFEDGLFDEEFSRNFYRQAVDASDVPLDYGVSPFERAAGRTSPPQAIWSPVYGKL